MLSSSSSPWTRLKPLASQRQLLVFENTINKELIRSLHVYPLETGERVLVRKRWSLRGNGGGPSSSIAGVSTFQFPPRELFEGRVFGLWLCSFAFHAHRLPRFFFIPCSLSISRKRSSVGIEVIQ
ncbi:hypothetical protein V6N13_127159 [Hibiscus sabdariffa]